MEDQKALSVMFNPLHSSTNQESTSVIEVTTMNKFRQFPLRKGSDHVQLPNKHFSLSAKMNGTHRRIDAGKVHEECIVRTAACQKGPSWAEVKLCKILKIL